MTLAVSGQLAWAQPRRAATTLTAADPRLDFRFARNGEAHRLSRRVIIGLQPEGNRHARIGPGPTTGCAAHLKRRRASRVLSATR